MSKQDTGDLLKFMLPFNDNVKAAALWLRDFVWDLYPDANELIYNKNYTLAFGWSPTDKAGDVFCSIALFTNHLNFGFNRGSEIPDREKRLLGNGSLYRYIQVFDREDFSEDYIKSLLAMAYENSISRLKPQKVIVQGQTIVKFTAAVKRREL
jgi:hypothetical protein